VLVTLWLPRGLMGLAGALRTRLRRSTAEAPEPQLREARP